MATTALDIITGSMRLIGTLAEGEPPTLEAANDSLMAFNQLLDSWSAAGNVVFTPQVQDISWASSVISKTVGPTGEFVGVRPNSADSSTYYTSESTDYSIKLITGGEYAAISNKDDSGMMPDSLYIDYATPNARLYIYPVPTKNIVLHLREDAPLSQIPSLATELTAPAGFMRAFRYNLAVEIAAEFGVEVPPAVKLNAWRSLRAVKKVNAKNMHKNRTSLPSFLTGSSSSILEG